jgi:hypothetical protein
MSEQRLATRRTTGLAGLGAAVLFGVGSALWAFDQPDAGAPVREVVAFYTDTSACPGTHASLGSPSFLLLVVGLAFVTPLSRFLLGPSFLLLAAVSVQLLRGSGQDAASNVT